MSAPNWFYAENENRLGPVPVEQIAHLIMSGGLDRVALVWRHGMPDWMEAGGVPEIASLLPPPLPPGKAPAKAKEARPEPARAEAPKPEPAKPEPVKETSPRKDRKAKHISDLPTLDGAAVAIRGLADVLVEKEQAPPAPAAAEIPIVVEEDRTDSPKVSWPGGRLADHEFAELVHEVHGRRWTGLLTLNHMGVERSVRIQEGRLVFASSSSADDRLGELLLRRGRITLDQYVEAGRGVRKGKRLGTVLVEMGALDARELVKVVVDHTQEIIYGAFQWTEGLYHFTETPDPAEPIVLRLSTPDIILEGIRRIDRWSRIERAVGTLETRYERAEGYEALLKQMTLSPDKLAILTTLIGVQDLGTICRRSAIPHFEVCRTLWAFRVIGVVRRLD